MIDHTVGLSAKIIKLHSEILIEDDLCSAETSIAIIRVMCDKIEHLLKHKPKPKE